MAKSLDVIAAVFKEVWRLGERSESVKSDIQVDPWQRIPGFTMGNLVAVRVIRSQRKSEYLNLPCATLSIPCLYRLRKLWAVIAWYIVTKI